MRARAPNHLTTVACATQDTDHIHREVRVLYARPSRTRHLFVFSLGHEVTSYKPRSPPFPPYQRHSLFRWIGQRIWFYWHLAHPSLFTPLAGALLRTLVPFCLHIAHLWQAKVLEFYVHRSPGFPRAHRHHRILGCPDRFGLCCCLRCPSTSCRLRFGTGCFEDIYTPQGAESLRIFWKVEE